MPTARQQSILDAIRQYTADHGHPPTIPELTAQVGLTSIGGVHRHLQRLRAHGWVTWTPSQARTLKVLRD